MKKAILAVLLTALTAVTSAHAGFARIAAEVAVESAIQKGDNLTVEKLEALYNCLLNNIDDKYPTSKIEEVRNLSKGAEACKDELADVDLFSRF